MVKYQNNGRGKSERPAVFKHVGNSTSNAVEMGECTQSTQLLFFAGTGMVVGFSKLLPLLGRHVRWKQVQTYISPFQI